MEKLKSTENIVVCHLRSEELPKIAELYFIMRDLEVPDKSKMINSGNFYEWVMLLFKQEEVEKRGLVQDFVTFLDLMGIQFRDILYVETIV